MYLEEANVVGVLTEALTAQVQTVLADEGRALSADTAIKIEFKLIIINRTTNNKR